MGDLDDAIREHLELKRRHGASDEEVATKEREAMKSGALPGESGGVPDEPVAAVPPAPPEFETREETSVSAPEPSPAVDDLEPRRSTRSQAPLAGRQSRRRAERR